MSKFTREGDTVRKAEVKARGGREEEGLQRVLG
jgi:hypothetical protein